MQRLGARGSLVWAMVVGAVMLGGPVAAGQETATDGAASYVPRLSYEVVSIHEDPPHPDGGYMIGGQNAPRSGTIDAVFRASDMVAMAFGVSGQNVSGGPGWVTETRFVVKARSDASVDETLSKLPREQVTLEKQHMMRVLVEERFKLKAHLVTKDATVYDLVVGKGGPKLVESKVVAVEGDDPKAVAAANEPNSQQRCGPAGCEMTASRLRMSVLAGLAGGQLNTKVEDKTGLSGKYDVKLLWTGKDFADAGDDGSHPPLRTALQEQLGLELKPRKGTRQAVVIDAIEMPSEN